MEYSDTLLNQARRQGDDLVDPLAAELLESCTSASKLGRQGYNHLLDVADKLIESPELLLLEKSNVRQDLENTSPGLRDYFDPISVPDWVEEERIARACRLWQENMISALAALYSTSLPQCYLIARDIPALFATGKLLKHDYLSQRIYETGLMLDAVLATDGIKILRDLPRDVGTTTRGVRYLWGRPPGIRIGRTSENCGCAPILGWEHCRGIHVVRFSGKIDLVGRSRTNKRRAKITGQVARQPEGYRAVYCELR